MFKYKNKLSAILTAGGGASLITSIAVNNGQNLKAAISITIYSTLIALVLDEIYFRNTY